MFIVIHDVQGKKTVTKSANVVWSGICVVEVIYDIVNYNYIIRIIEDFL